MNVPPQSSFVRADGGASQVGRPSEESVRPDMTAVEVSDLSGVETGSDTMVQQSFRDDVDVNEILRRFGAQVFRSVGDPRALYGDFTEIHDYDSAVEKVEKLNSQFMSLPAAVREKFENSPSKFLYEVSSMTQEQFDAMLAPVPRDVTGPAGEPVPAATEVVVE